MLVGAGFGIPEVTDNSIIEYIDGFLDSACERHRFAEDEAEAFVSIKKIGATISPIYDADGNVIGRAAMHPNRSYANRAASRETLKSRLMLSVGGMLTTRPAGFSHLPLLGILPARPVTVDRKKVMVDILPESLAQWATEQSDIHAGSHSIELSSLVLWFGGDPKTLPFILKRKSNKTNPVAYCEFLNLVTQLSELNVLFSGGEKACQEHEESRYPNLYIFPYFNITNNILAVLPSTTQFSYPIQSPYSFGGAMGYSEYSSYMDEFLAFISMRALEKALAHRWGKFRRQDTMTRGGYLSSSLLLSYSKE